MYRTGILLICATFWFLQRDQVRAANGLIWNKYVQKFVALSTIKRFADLQEEVIKKKREVEHYRFHGETVTGAFYQQLKMIEFRKNDTVIGGLFGEIWNILADHLNFTLVLLRSKDPTYGICLADGSCTGILGLLQNNKTQVILRSPALDNLRGSAEFTNPIYKTRFWYMIQPLTTYDDMWMITLFSKYTLFIITAFFVILILTGYGLQILYKKYKSVKKLKSFSLNDHFFYSYTILCEQGNVLAEYLVQFKMLSLLKIFFCWMIYQFFNATMIDKMTYNILKSISFNHTDILFRTNYKIILSKSSIVSQDYLNVITAFHGQSIISKRFVLVETLSEAIKKCCHSKNKYAVFDSRDTFMALRREACPLIPASNSGFPVWITFAIASGLPYKRTIDVAIMRLHELGLIRALTRRWLYYDFDYPKKTTFAVIELHQVKAVFIFFYIGLALSLIIFVLERVVFILETWQKQQKRKKRKY